MILSLRTHVKSMNADDKEVFEMLQKRDRDDEDLDSIALQQLNHLHDRYVTKRSKRDLEAGWNKLTGG